MARKGAPEHHRNNAQETGAKQQKRQRRHTREGERGNQTTQKEKKRKEEHDQRSSRAEPGGKRREGKGKVGRGKKGKTATRSLGPGKHQRRKAQDQEEEEEGENIRAELPYCATDLNTGQTRGAVDSFGGRLRTLARFPDEGCSSLCNP